MALLKQKRAKGKTTKSKKAKSTRGRKKGSTSTRRKYASILAAGNVSNKKLNLLFYKKSSKKGKKEIAKKFGRTFLLKLIKK